MSNKRTIKKELNRVANFRDKNEKASWIRKKKNLEALALELDPIEHKILELTHEKMILIDSINEIRKIMIADCVHPSDYLIHYDTYIQCRFCETKLVLVDGDE